MPGTVLVVEDEAHLATLLRDILQASGYDVVLTTGRRAAERTVELEPVAIVMDYMMPGLDGSEVVSQIRAAVPEGAPPVVLVTGLPNARELATRVGAQAYLRKPFDVDAFVAVVDDLSTRPAS